MRYLVQNSTLRRSITQAVRVWRWLWSRRSFRRAVALASTLGLLLMLAYVGISFSIAAQLVHVKRQPLNQTPADYGLRYREIAFQATDGLALTGWLVEPSQQQAVRKVIILLQDAGSGRGDSLIMALIAELANAGFAVLVFDGRGHGTSEGEYYTLGYSERYDLLGALNYAKSQGFAPGQIGVIGLGTGGATALLTLPETSDIAALAVDSAYASLPDQLRSRLKRQHLPSPLLRGVNWAVRLRYGLKIEHILPEAALVRYVEQDFTERSPSALLLIHGEQDLRVPPDHAQRLLAASRAVLNSQLWLVPDAGHLQAIKLHREAYLQRMITFFEATLVSVNE